MLAMQMTNPSPSAGSPPGVAVSPREPALRRWWWGIPVAVVGGGLALLAAPPAPPPGRLLASQCFQCHGTNGKAVSGFESIVGQGANDMYQKLLEMSQRPAEGIMDLQARAYTPAQLRLIANYLATLPADDAEPLGD